MTKAMTMTNLLEKILGLFIKFQIIWGNKWSNNIKSNAEFMRLAASIWADGLYDLSQEQIDNALHVCLESFDQPPSISEFRKVALDLPSFHIAYQIITDAYKSNLGLKYISNQFLRDLFIRLGSTEGIAAMNTADMWKLIKCSYEFLLPSYLLTDKEKKTEKHPHLDNITNQL